MIESRPQKINPFFSALGKAFDFCAQMDKITPIAIIILCVFGVLGIYSSGSFRGSDEWIKQIVFIALGVGAYIGIMVTPPQFFKNNAILIYIFGTVLLVPIAISALTHINFGNFIHDVNGSRRWYFLGSFGLQPSEFAKITALIFLAKTLSFSPLTSFRRSYASVVKTAAIVGVPAGLIVVEPDLGSTLIYPPLALALLWMAGLKSRFFIVVFAIGAILGGIIATDIYFYRERIVDYYEANDHPRDPARDIRGQYQAVSWVPLKDYQRERLLSFIDPETIDPRGTGSSWNVRQSLICVGKGGLTGAGFSNGMQAKLGYLPELAAHNDFLFSVIAEEYGFAGCGTILGIYLLMLIRIIQIAYKINDPFCSLIATGIAVILFIHIFINIGMNIGLMPVTGLSLPFMSYGGSFVLSCFILLGLLQSVYAHRKSNPQPKIISQPEIQKTLYQL
ncbi:MAG: rod shape-determining protein RodA [Opitutales bacterium]|nr:rod shape-determining protein RodA [Opitutales bacterium]